jgi:hypothetical protein
MKNNNMKIILMPTNIKKFLQFGLKTNVLEQCCLTGTIKLVIPVSQAITVGVSMVGCKLLHFLC